MLTHRVVLVELITNPIKFNEFELRQKSVFFYVISELIQLDGEWIDFGDSMGNKCLRNSRKEYNFLTEKKIIE
jgi:hypothetical protein